MAVTASPLTRRTPTLVDASTHMGPSEAASPWRCCHEGSTARRRVDKQQTMPVQPFSALPIFDKPTTHLAASRQRSTSSFTPEDAKQSSIRQQITYSRTFLRHCKPAAANKVIQAGVNLVTRGKLWRDNQINWKAITKKEKSEDTISVAAICRRVSLQLSKMTEKVY